MSKYFKEVHDILESNGEAYETKYPEIADLNVFSISTLAKSIESQVNWKMKGQKGSYPFESFVGKAFFSGRSTHEFIQNRLKYVSEFPVKWQSEDFIRNKSGFKLIGHCDLVDFREDYVLEFKTTVVRQILLCRQREFVAQAGTYAAILNNETGRTFHASVFVINDRLHEYQLTEQDILTSFKIIRARARVTVDELTKLGKLPG